MMGQPQRSVTAPVGMQHTRSMSYREKSLHDVEAPLETPISTAADETAIRCKENTFAAWRPSRWNIRYKNKDLSNVAAQSKPSHFAYLDGLRGFAALLVYSLHHQGWAHSSSEEEYFILENAYGWDNKYYFICLPGVRIFFSGGHFAVAMFFVISGYVLAAGPLRAIHNRDTARLADGIGSALFRRWLRLFLPVLATTFVWMTSWHLLGIQSNNPGAESPESTYLDELWKWYCDFKNFSFIFTGEARNAYNDHAWSIPIEFRGSICIYTCLLAFRSVGHTKRLLCETALVLYFMYIVDGWFCCLFIIGMLLCDIDLLRIKGELPRAFGGKNPMPMWVPYVLMLASLYLGGVPSISGDIDHLRKSPGWYWLSFLKPQAVYDFRWFYRTIAATLAMIAIPRIKLLKAFFESSFCQYLGKISFAFYLVQGPVLWSFGDRIYAATGRTRENHITLVPKWINYSPFPNWGIFGLEVNFLAAQLILLPVTLWLADVVTRAIDGPSIKLSKWAFDFAISED